MPNITTNHAITYTKFRPQESAVQFFPVPDTIRNLDYRIALASAAGFTVLLWTTSGRIGRERGVSFFSPFLVLKLLTVSVTVTIGG